VRLDDDLAVEPEVIPPARVDPIELGVDAPDVGVFADEPVAARFENLPQRDIRKVLERLDDGPTSLVPGPECDRKLAHVVKCRANSLTAAKAAHTTGKPLTPQSPGGPHLTERIRSGVGLAAHDGRRIELR
jgi:hypothetical protein